MLSEKELFLNHLAQTSGNPPMLEVERAEGVYIYARSGKKYLDLISGISVSNIGHRHPKVTEAVKQQSGKHLHVMAYGEFIQYPQVQLAALLAENLPESLNCAYLVGSGSEAVEGALKLAKKHTGRTGIIACKNAYHGSTHGAMSVMGNPTLNEGYGPLLPGVRLIEFNNLRHLEEISEKTACVIIEPIQGDAGVLVPGVSYLKALREKCTSTGTLLIFDEVQTGFGRTGTLFAFEQFGAVPDVLVLAKALGAGMPLGAFVASRELMQCLSHNPELGFITTFGGHPVSCAAGIAGLKALLEENLMDGVKEKERLFRALLTHPLIREIRSRGLMMAVEMDNPEFCRKAVSECLLRGIITDRFLFAGNCFRIAPPLCINEEEIGFACNAINESIEEVSTR